MERVTSLTLVPHHARALAIITVFAITKKIEKRRKRRWWVRELFRQRIQYGNRLIRDMTVDKVDETIKNFTRMSMEDFESLESLVGPQIVKMDTFMREAITVRERLAITLRFLATGDSYTSLQYLFRVSKSAISLIIPEVCDAITTSLDEYVKVSE